MRENNLQNGFVALMSVIIISAILLLVAGTLSFSGFYSRYNILDSELKDRSSALAEACVDHTLLKIATNPAYSGAATTSIGSEQCYTYPITPSTPTETFETLSLYKNYYTHLRIKVSAPSLSIISWEELP